MVRNSCSEGEAFLYCGWSYLGEQIAEHRCNVDRSEFRVTATRVTTRQIEKILNEVGHVARFASDFSENFGELFFGAFTTKGDFAGGEDEGERSAKFVRGVSREPLDGTKGCFDALEHGIEGLRKSGEFVFGWGNAETRCEIGGID
jgi:hypothetical protein